MFSATFPARSAQQRLTAGAYHQVGIQTSVTSASSHQLVSLLFDAYFTAISRALHAMQHKDVQAKGAAISHAVRLIDEGLKASLNITAGGKLATDLSDLYAYICLRLTQANLRNDEQALEECRQLMQPLRDAWDSISEHQEVLNRI